MRKIIFVDMGETLVSFSPKFHQPIYYFLVKKGYNVSEKKVFRTVYKLLGKDHFPDPILGGLSVLDYKELLSELNITPKKCLLEELKNIPLLSDKWELFEDSEPFLKKLKDENFKVIMITNSTRSVYRIVSDLGLDKYLDDIIASCDYGIMKPHPRIFRIAIEKHGKPILHVGDVYEIDYLGAIRAGISPVLLDRFNFYEDLKVNKVKNLFQLLGLIKNH
ncbi:HAD family hydrolase [Sulfurisphaera ohwakuensis]|uniref:HAD superfamily hydrolase (TIGR01549 family) n=1 Tax=Sulfurisphaera ohwakuensis TaxID=69656 RepID=A0A650CIT4_SULOH|nr:HAD family hydrolase [Sulfurisphaera ohwakuensis]MBB5253463.1 HAD superfamily hydrolase (TIGR01549 family) [Sulfurisphaera ohwakuensis]QGR17774.1 HAD-IA family hydrolase [Sulfurisphaera ohwakuensis]